MRKTLVERIYHDIQKTKKTFRTYDPNYQMRVVKVRMIAWGWFAFICLGAGIFVCCTPYMDRKREERGEALEYRSAPASTMFESFLARGNKRELESPEEYVQSLKDKV